MGGVVEPVQRLSVADLPTVAALGEFPQAEGFITIDPNAFEFHWRHILDNNLGAIFGRIEDGACIAVIGCALEANLFNAETMAVEAFWYVHPDHRGGPLAAKLLDAYDKWARDNAATKQFITRHFTDQGMALDKLYRRRGFRQDAVTYVREVDYGQDEGVA
jgi:GNAT superfamily N-acetyltransferase